MGLLPTRGPQQTSKGDAGWKYLNTQYIIINVLQYSNSDLN